MPPIDLNAHYPGLSGFGVQALPAAAEPRLRHALQRAGFAVRVLEGACIRDPASFFAEVARALALPDWFGANWDALNDSLAGLHDGGERRVAVLWRDAQDSLSADVQTVLAAAQCFGQAADFVDDGDPREPLQLGLFLLGVGPGFGPGG